VSGTHAIDSRVADHLLVELDNSNPGEEDLVPNRDDIAKLRSPSLRDLWQMTEAPWLS
jgi:hypothetical protein